MKRYPRFVIRKIRNGRVKIFGRWYYASDQYEKYDGRLDGLRYAFGLYERDGVLQDFVYLWGGERQFHTIEDLKEPVPEMLEDGGLPWCWWNVRENERTI